MEAMEMTRLPSVDFWRGKRVFLTGHSGFKGTWAHLWLSHLGAEVSGYALTPATDPSLHSLVAIDASCRGTTADLRDIAALKQAMLAANPDIIIHLAAQPLVRKSYAQPLETFSVNAMGTANLLDCALALKNLKAALIVTTDKVYRNDESGRHFRENDVLGGHDPYSGSKAAAEIIAATYRTAFYNDRGISLATARGGNVIGGGDFSEDRLIPDIIRSHALGTPLEIRNPHATRPWQHVLDCLNGYFLYCEDLYEGGKAPSSLNFGPPVEEGQISVGTVATTVLKAFEIHSQWIDTSSGTHLKEMQSLGLDPNAANDALGWHSQLKQLDALAWTAAWYRDWLQGQDAHKLTLSQIMTFMEGQ